jgi:Mn-dependent DtxR family transcriptional regulator
LRIFAKKVEKKFRERKRNLDFEVRRWYYLNCTAQMKTTLPDNERRTGKMRKNNASPDNVTARQWQYLFYLHTRRGRNRTLAACAEHFGISRQGAESVFDTLSDKGFVLREGNAITLTEKAREGLYPLTEQRDELEVFLQSAVGHAEAQANDEAVKMVYTLPADTTEIMTARFLAERVLAPENRDTGMLPDGVYPIYDFTVYKSGGNEILTSHDGFRRPIMFVSAYGLYGLEIRAKTIRHTLPDGTVGQGTLTKLQYLRDGAYTECAALCGRWNIPGNALAVTREGDSFVFRMDFLANAGPACRMPADSRGCLIFTVSAESERMLLRAEKGAKKQRSRTNAGAGKIAKPRTGNGAE